jgi:alkanesulfonate monooxygenase SsuD/methylene tetrahydromethanopterin reductase-like flavin-dependent oxidoreductase (luciferase family)
MFYSILRRSTALAEAAGGGSGDDRGDMELAVQVNGTYEHVAEVAATAEAAGFSAVALADHYLNGSGPSEYVQPVFDSLTQAAGLARDTSAIEILTLVSPVTFRHPAVYAKTAVTIDDLSGGRFALGLGAGWHEDEHDYFGLPFPGRAERYSRLADALGYLHAYRTQPERGYDGRFWRLAPFEVRPRMRQDARLVVGGTGPRLTPELAGRFAGEYNLALHEPEVVRARIDTMRRAASAAGRAAGAIRVSTAYRMIGGDTTSEVDEFLAEWGAGTGRSVAEMREHVGERIPILRWDEHLERLEDLGRLGFDRVYVKVVTKSRRAFADAARHLTPLLRSANVNGERATARRRPDLESEPPCPTS